MTYEQLNTLAVWQRMPTIDLDRIAAVRLMNRVDTKYLLDEACCMRLFEMAARAVLRAGDRLVPRLPLRDALLRHAAVGDVPPAPQPPPHAPQGAHAHLCRDGSLVPRGQAQEQQGTHAQAPHTHRGDIFATAPHDAAAADFLRGETPYAPETLTPALTTRFVRVTLVNRAMTERLTLDFDLHFTNERGDGATASMQGLVIVELKQDALAPSPMKDILAQLRVKPFKVSKYCVGEAMTNPQVKHNRFKAKLRAIAKMSLNANKTTTL